MPPRTSRRHKQGAESRERILEVALEISAERGYDGTTMALVTERSGLPASSVYWHFKNKDALLAEVLELSYTQWRQGEDAWEATDDGDLRTRFRGRFERVRLGLATQPEFWRFGLMLALLSGGDPIAARDRFLEVRADTIGSTVAWCRAVLGADAVARHPELPVLLTQFFMASADGLFLSTQIDPRWSYGRITDALGRAVGEVALALASAPPSRKRRKPAPLHRSEPRPAPEDSRERLLWAASRVAAERGYVGTTISRVCAESGLPVSSVYWYFDDKDALLGAVVQSSWETWLEHQPTWEPVVGAEQRDAVLRTVLLEGTRSFLDSPDFLRVGHGVTLARQDLETAAHTLFRELRRDTERLLTTWFVDTFEGSPHEGDKALAVVLARIVIAVTDGLFVAEQIDDWEWDLEAFVDLLVAVLEQVIDSAPPVKASRRRTTS
ncbi:MAG: TetR/AcrR family transcriptional regulator [Candidatus Nanopelagicales bacterium]